MDAIYKKYIVALNLRVFEEKLKIYALSVLIFWAKIFVCAFFYAFSISALELPWGHFEGTLG